MTVATLSFPFGKDVDTLILCRDEDHRRRAIAALGIPARYELIMSALQGCRFTKIIVLGADKPLSATEAKKLDVMAKEYWPTMLEIGGKVHLL
jgi:hypothetical protein